MQRGERRVDGVLDSDLLYHRNQFCLNKLIMKEKKKDILLKLNPLNRARACIGCGTPCRSDCGAMLHGITYIERLVLVPVFRMDSLVCDTDVFCVFLCGRSKSDSIVATTNTFKGSAIILLELNRIQISLRFLIRLERIGEHSIFY